MVEIFLKASSRIGRPHPHFEAALENYQYVLQKLGWSREGMRSEVEELFAKFGLSGN